ncbi:MAG: UPF0262 family protein [Rhizobiales bacterium]|nr:UPF0262 family protein [Hyphomicrobiales bacterium]
MSDVTSTNTNCLFDIILDEDTIRRNTPDIDHEREVAIFDLLEENYFELAPREGKTALTGPFILTLSLVENRLIFHIADQENNHLVSHTLSLSPFKKTIKDYFLICESYFEAIKTATPQRIEAIDMGRRGLHDEGSELLIERLKDKILLDKATSRRLFTLITALHWKG